MIKNSWRYSVPDGQDIHVQRGDILAEYSLLGTVITWVVESIDDGGLELSRGAERKRVGHGTVLASFVSDDVIVGAPS